MKCKKKKLINDNAKINYFFSKFFVLCYIFLKVNVYERKVFK